MNKYIGKVYQEADPEGGLTDDPTLGGNMNGSDGAGNDAGSDDNFGGLFDEDA